MKGHYFIRSCQASHKHARNDCLFYRTLVNFSDDVMVIVVIHHCDDLIVALLGYGQNLD